jgi:FkbM family methyltransferase
MLSSLRSFGQHTLRRWPALYALAKRTYGYVSFRLGKPHEEDFAFFRNLRGEPGVFVDVGANAGQSARSLRLFNQDLRIVSFEPNKLLEPELRFTKRLLGADYEYRMHGLGSARQAIELFVPLAGRTPMTPWATADRQTLESNLPTIERELGTRITVETVPVEILRFDDVGLVPTVVKIDVEGFELDVLLGMLKTIEHARPVFMIEASRATPEIHKLLRPFGYRFFLYDAAENKLSECSGTVDSTNYFACPAKVLEQFARSGVPQVVAAEPVN